MRGTPKAETEVVVAAMAAKTVMPENFMVEGEREMEGWRILYTVRPRESRNRYEG